MSGILAFIMLSVGSALMMSLLSLGLDAAAEQLHKNEKTRELIRRILLIETSERLVGGIENGLDKLEELWRFAAGIPDPMKTFVNRFTRLLPYLVIGSIIFIIIAFTLIKYLSRWVLPILILGIIVVFIILWIKRKTD